MAGVWYEIFMESEVIRLNLYREFFCLRSKIPGQKIHNNVLDSGICYKYSDDEDRMILHPRYLYIVSWGVI